MKFLNDRDKKLWPYIHKKLREFIEATDKFCAEKYGKELLVTDTIRLFSEQKEIDAQILKVNPDYRPPKASLHCFGNAVDAGQTSSNGIAFTRKEMNEIQKWYSDRYPYGYGEYLSCLIHTGTGLHFHFQLNMRIFGQGFNPDNQEAMKCLMEAIRGPA